MKQTTKVCPHCGDPQLVSFTSTSEKWCSGCRLYLPWHLDEGQKPLLISCIVGGNMSGEGLPPLPGVSDPGVALDE